MSGGNPTLMRTRCPECSSVFRVTSEQLRRKAGKVRCGNCQAVFNAFDNWLAEAPEDTETPATQPAVPETQPQPAVPVVSLAPVEPEIISESFDPAATIVVAHDWQPPLEAFEPAVSLEPVFPLEVGISSEQHEAPLAPQLEPTLPPREVAPRFDAAETLVASPADHVPLITGEMPPLVAEVEPAAETPDTREGVVDGKNVRVKYRLIFVWSQAKAEQEAQTRQRHLTKIREEFEAVERNLNKYSLKTEEAIQRRLEAAKARYPEGKVFVYQLTADKKKHFYLTWKMDRRALQKLEQLDGVYVLKTNLPVRRCPTVQALGTYKGQSQVERRFHHLKGPLAVAPMFLEKPERMSGLVCILVWALTILALMERQVRSGLKGKPMYGLYPENRPSPSPTGPAILECFSTLCIVIVKEHGHVFRRLADATPVQRKLLLLLGVPPEELRTFKRRCGM